MRSFNVACNVMFFISIVFAFPFFGYLEVPQIVFYMIFILVGLSNLAFLVVGEATKVAWVRNRRLTVLLPVLLMISLQMASMNFFLRQLDEMHDKLNNMYPVSEHDELLLQSFVIINMLLFYMMPLFMGVSFFAYTSELGRKLEDSTFEGAEDARQNLV